MLDDLTLPLPGSDPIERHYRALILSPSNYVLRTEHLSAGGDDEAFTIAQNMVDGHAVDLWDGLRFIEHFTPYA